MTVNIKISIAVVAVLFCLVGAKMHVNQEFNKINAKIKERDLLAEEVRILEAELSYLNSMDRVEKLASQYLSLNAVANKVIVLGNGEKSNATNVQIIETKHTPNWNYKNRSHIVNVKHSVR